MKQFKYILIYIVYKSWKNSDCLNNRGQCNCGWLVMYFESTNKNIADMQTAKNIPFLVFFLKKKYSINKFVSLHTHNLAFWETK